ncbi:MAG: hypothetical protein HY822_09250 [Acidobacteria bacterium]|nr:hypothetical protein [Acidobacteriota bacterium]
MRCLYCGKRLALLRKLTDGEFCSAAHRTRHRQEEQHLAVARLQEQGQRSTRLQPEEPAPLRKTELAPKPGVIRPRTTVTPLLQATRPCVAERDNRAAWRSGPRDASPQALPLGVRAAVFAVAARSPSPLRCSPALVAPSPVEETPGRLQIPLVEPRELPQARCPQWAIRRPKARVFLRLASPLQPTSASHRPVVSVAVPEVLAATGVGATDGAGFAIAAAALCALPVTVSVALPRSSGLGTSGLPVPAVTAPEFGAAFENIHTRTFPLTVAPACPRPVWRAARAGRIPFGAEPAKPEDFAAGPTAELRRAKARSQVWAAQTGKPAEFPALPPAPEASLAAPLRAGRRPPRHAPAPRLAPLGGTASPLPRLLPPRIQPESADAAFSGFAARRACLPAVPAGEDAPNLAQNDRLFGRAVKALDGAVNPPVCSGRQVSVAGAPLFPSASGFKPAIALLQRPELAPVASLEARHSAPAASGDANPFAPAAPPPGMALRTAPIMLSPAPGRSLFELRWPWSPRSVEPRPKAVFETLTAIPAPCRPKSRLATEFEKPARKAAGPVAARLSMPSATGSWKAASRFWKTAPADLKWLALALPLVLGVALVSSLGWLPSRSIAPPPGAAQSRSSQIEGAIDRQLVAWKSSIASRAAINLQDDFRAGLSNWEGRGDWAKDWQYDSAGFLLTGPLALYRPSRELSDYRFEFLGQIDRKSLNWAYRATDHNNYYAMKIVLHKSGPLPAAVMVRYAMVNGKPEGVVQAPLPMTVRSDMFYRVAVEVRGSDFTTSVQGQIVDHWSDQRFDRGAVGFFSDKGERARLRWVEVSHQYDVLGRLCALLAPYSLPSTNGSLNRQ